MSIQILVPLQTYPEGNTDKLAGHASSLARHLGASIHAIALEADFPRIGNPLANFVLDTNDVIESAKATCKRKSEALQQTMKAAAGEYAISLSMEISEYLPADLNPLIVGESRYRDLTILGLNGNDLTLRASAEEVLFGSGRPVVLVPEELAVSNLAHVAIAWDGSRVATRAVADASPLLQRAERVTILCVSDEKKLPGYNISKKLADHLARHEIDSTILEIETGARAISETLQVEAMNAGAGLMVMGGFGHSRMRDFVLGGATNGILADLRMSVLISH